MVHSVDDKRLSFIHTKYFLYVRMNLISARDTYVPCYKFVVYKASSLRTAVTGNCRKD